MATAAAHETSQADASAPGAFDRLASFRVTYIAFFFFVFLYVQSVSWTEQWLHAHFREALNRAIDVSPEGGRVPVKINRRVQRVINNSRWTRIGGVKVAPTIVAADMSVLYSRGPWLPGPLPDDPAARHREGNRLLPATVGDLIVTLPHTSLLAAVILVAYAAIFLTTAFVYARAVGRREDALIREAQSARTAAAERAAEIERELDAVRTRIAKNPIEKDQAEKIRALRAERSALQDKLASVARREEELRGEASRSQGLDEEHQALEEMLEEALHDLSRKDEEIGGLQDRLKSASKTGAGSSRSREADQWGKRLRTLYKTLEFDDRAISDIVALRDETMRLKAEESIKRLADETENALIRRKVGGLPPQRAIFELGFAGKGRIYYCNSERRRFRILAIGAKNTQKTDLEYLSRLS